EEIPIYIQTKGGVQSAIDEILEILPQSVWYISISHDNEETRSLIEKPTPTIEERFELIKRLKKLGHKVQVGINPAHPDWIKDVRHFLVTLKKLQVDSLIIQPLKLTVNQSKNLSEKSKIALGNNVKECLTNHKKSLNTRYQDFIELLKEDCKLLRINYFLLGSHEYTKALHVIHDTYQNTFPTMNDFINYCHVQKIDVFGFQDYWNYFSSWLPNVRHSVCHKYITSKMQVNKIPFEIPKGKVGFKEVLYMGWLSERSSYHPIAYNAFAYLIDDNGRRVYDSKYNLPQFVFNPKGW
ncbi:MAG TPA: radical SAM protein, partial [Allocoleopsis sp.]